VDLGLERKPGLARCPKCNELIDAASHTCRYCGSELNTAELQEAAEVHRRQVQETARKNNRRALIAGLGSITFTVAVVGLWFGGKLWLHDKVLELDRNDRIEERIKQRDLNAAISLTTEYLRSDPDDAELHMLLGRSFVLKEDRAKAQAEFEKVLQLDPNNAQAPYFMGLLLYEKNQYQAAETLFSKSIEHGLKNVNALKFRGVSRAMISKMDLAMEDFKAAEQLDPKAFRVDCGLGMVEAMKGAGDSAIKHLKVCVDQFPTDPVYRLLLGAQSATTTAPQRPH